MGRMRAFWNHPWGRRAITLATLLVIYVVLTVDNWGRDFVSNSAEVRSTDYPQVSRMLEGRSPQHIAAALEQAAQRIPTFGPTQRLDDGGTIRLAWVRKSKLLRFKDDIVMRIERDGRHTVVSGSSKSRFGLGDLGQNPRNLEMLLGEMAVVLDLGQSAQLPALKPPLVTTDDPYR